MTSITPNIVVCPNCEKEFVHNRVNGIALLDIIQSVDAKKRMHCRLTLNALEKEFDGKEVPRSIRKAILDGYSDLSRDVQAILGFGVDVE